MSANIYATPDNYLQTSYDEFYIPTEVNGKFGGKNEKLDAHAALYEYENAEP